MKWQNNTKLSESPSGYKLEIAGEDLGSGSLSIPAAFHRFEPRPLLLVNGAGGVCVCRGDWAQDYS